MHCDKFTQIGGQRRNDIMYCKHLFGSKQNQNFQNKRQFTGLGKEEQLKVQSSDG